MSSGPHGFGGTFKSHEKGGTYHSNLKRKLHQQQPLSERGITQHNKQHHHNNNNNNSNSNSNSNSNKKTKVGRIPLHPTTGRKQGTTIVKQKIRDLKRLMNKPGLDESIRRHKESELKQLTLDLETLKNDKKCEEIDAKYKQVKFFEYRKILRKLNALQRQLAQLTSKHHGDVQSSDEKALRKQINEWKEKLQYIKFYPPGHKYISLFKASTESPDKLQSKINDIKKLIAARVREHEKNSGANSAKTTNKKQEENDELFEAADSDDDDDDQSDSDDDDNDNKNDNHNNDDNHDDDNDDDDDDDSQSDSSSSSSSPAPAPTKSKSQSKSSTTPASSSKSFSHKSNVPSTSNNNQQQKNKKMKLK